MASVLPVSVWQHLKLLNVCSVSYSSCMFTLYLTNIFIQFFCNVIVNCKCLSPLHDTVFYILLLLLGFFPFLTVKCFFGGGIFPYLNQGPKDSWC